MWRSAALAAAAAFFCGALGCAAGEVLGGADDDAGGEDPGDASFPDVRHDALPGTQFDVGAGDDAGAGFDATPGDAGPKDGGGDGASASCTSPNDCAGAAVIQSVSGDTGADTRTVQGYTSKWFQVLVTEDNSSLINGEKLHVTAVLTSPPGANFDLYLYIDEGGSKDTRACGGTPNESSTNSAGQADTVSHTWGEGAVPNGKDDSRTVSLEVRAASGTCDPNAKWTLTVTGH